MDHDECQKRLEAILWEALGDDTDENSLMFVVSTAAISRDFIAENFDLPYPPTQEGHYP